MYHDPAPPDPGDSFLADPIINAAVKKFAAALEAHTPNWRSRLSPIEKFISGYTYRIDPARLPTPPGME